MSDNNEEKSWWQKLLLWVVTSPVTVILLGAAAYYGARAYLLDIEPWRSKVLMFAALGLWVLWLVFKNLIKFLLLLAVVGAIGYGYYRYVNCLQRSRPCVERRKANMRRQADFYGKA